MLPVVCPTCFTSLQVDPVNTVQFSNHTAYPGGIRGQVYDGAALRALAEGLTINSLLQHTHLLTGSYGIALGCNAAAPHRLMVLRCLCLRSSPPAHGDGASLVRSPGYIGSVSLLEAIAELYDSLKANSPGLTYGARA
jgi:pyridoxal/pyridoxine/pyridoxamine kinase